MKIGCVYWTYTGNLPPAPGDMVDYRCFGENMSKQRAPEDCPLIYFEYPIARLVTAVLWKARLKNGAVLSQDIPFLWVNLALLELKEKHPEGIGLFVPKLALLIEEPPREIVLRLKYAIAFWQPFTSLVAASKLLPALLDMSPSERAGFLGKIGQSQNRQALRVKHQKDFIVDCWANWEKAELSYEERIDDMVTNGVPITDKNFRQFVSRMKLKRYSLE